MRKKILAAIVSGLFLGYSEEPISSHEMRVHLRERNTATSPAPERTSSLRLENLLFSIPGTVSIPIEERVTEFCAELPWVLDDQNNLPANSTSNPTPTRKGFYQLQNRSYLYTHRPARSYGCIELLQRLNSTAEQIYAEYGTTLQVHDLSRENGEYIPPHKSHRGGLDADVGMYWYKDNGYGNSYGYLKKLDEKTLQVNWDFIKTLQKDRDIGYIFWSQRYIWSMRQFVQERYGTEEWRKYGKVLYHQPGHSDHFHVRVTKQNKAGQGLAANN